ncbi:putative DD34D transposase [Trichonephila clavipes]|nr:putative DD34D transposase [Trichonephila clavipes]
MFGCHTKKHDGLNFHLRSLGQNEIDSFLKRMVTEDEKWVTYDSIVRKPELTARKVLLCVWWDWKGIICYELLLYGQTQFKSLLSTTGPFESSD